MTTSAEQNDWLAGYDIEAHNDEVRTAWNAFHAGAPYRVPVIFGTATRYFMEQPQANAERLSFRRYTEDPDAMYAAQLRFERWRRFNLLQDAELGLPDKWLIHVDFQNYYEAAWFGCPLEYFDGEVPDTRAIYADCPERVLEGGLPDPFGGIMARALEYYEHFRARAARDEYLGRPIEIHPPWCGMGSDGPMTVACSLFGPAFVCMTMAADPARLYPLFEFITEATLRRMTAWRQRFGVPVPQDGFGMADDSIALISTRMYREHVLPHHRRLYDALGTDKPRSIHLCGDSTRHFVTIRDELNVRNFDTGFPVDFERLRDDLGPDVIIQGGPHVELLRTGTPEQIEEEVKHIFWSGVALSGKFVLREGNNLAPGTPLENTEAMYRAGRHYGRLK